MVAVEVTMVAAFFSGSDDSLKIITNPLALQSYAIRVPDGNLLSVSGERGLRG